MWLKRPKQCFELTNVFATNFFIELKIICFHFRCNFYFILLQELFGRNKVFRSNILSLKC